MKKKSVSFTAAVMYIVASLALSVTLISLGVSYFSYRDSISIVYEDMAESITGVALHLTDQNVMHDLAVKTYEVYSKFANPLDSYANDKENYLSAFREIQDSPEYKATWDQLESVRTATASSSVGFVIMIPDQNYCLYIMDCSGANVYPCGSLYPMDTSAYLQNNASFKSFISMSEVYGEVYTNGTSCCTLDLPDINSYLVADIPVSGAMNRAKMFISQTGLIVIFLIILLLYFITRRIKKKILAPLNEISDTTKHFVETYDKYSASDSNVFDNIDGGEISEFQNLADCLKSMEKDLNGYVSHLETLTAEKTKLSTELKLAESIQNDMLPSIFPAFPERKEFDVYASMDPAREIGGDFYDFFLLDDDHLALVIADVSGKGIPAALFMMMSKIIIANSTEPSISPADVLAKVNNSICENNSNEMFVTVWLGILEISSGKIRCANAGHEYPFIRRAGGQFEVVKDTHGLVIGFMPGLTYQDYELEFHTGDTLFVYTDGLPESANKENKQFGLERIRDTLNLNPDDSPKNLLKVMSEHVDEFVGGADQFDDLTMLCIKGLNIPSGSGEN